ncbi:MAG: hypothetical protein IT198_13225 [Acidimicrobiia bacterium]|nr:hypothetical protein [Acidimicrobiia bacterium]
MGVTDKTLDERPLFVLGAHSPSPGLIDAAVGWLDRGGRLTIRGRRREAVADVVRERLDPSEPLLEVDEDGSLTLVLPD